MKYILFLLVSFATMAQDRYFVPDQNIENEHVIGCSHTQIELKPEKQIQRKAARSARVQLDSINAVDLILNDSNYRSFIGLFDNISNTTLFETYNVVAVSEYLNENIGEMLSDVNQTDRVNDFLYYYRILSFNVSRNPDYFQIDSEGDAAVFSTIAPIYSHPNFIERTAVHFSAIGLMAIVPLDERHIDSFHILFSRVRQEVFPGGLFRNMGSIFSNAFFYREIAFTDAVYSDGDFFIEEITNILNNDNAREYLPAHATFLAGMYKMTEDYNGQDGLDLENIKNSVDSFIDTSEFNSKFHRSVVKIFIKSNLDFVNNMTVLKDQYFDMIFPKGTKSYDNGRIKITSGASDNDDNLYLELRDTRENFFKLSENTRPLDSTKYRDVNMYLFDSKESYTDFGPMFFNINPVGSGVYYDYNSSFYLFNRDPGLKSPINTARHEYIHHLDKQYNRPDSAESLFRQYRVSLWWMEGLATYASATSSTNGLGFTPYPVYLLINSTESNRLTMDQSVKEGYNQNAVYTYGQITWSWLYREKPAELKELFRLMQAGETLEFVDLLYSITLDPDNEISYQNYIQQVIDDYNAGLIVHPEPESYDFTTTQNSLDDISEVLEEVNLVNNYNLTVSDTSPYEFVSIHKDTIIDNNTYEINDYLWDLTKKFDEKSTKFSGFETTTARIDSIRPINDNFKVFYTIEFTTVGEITNTALSVENENIETDRVIVYKNPTPDYFKIKGIEDGTRLRVYNLNGILVKEYRSGENKQYDISDLNPNVYILRFNKDSKTFATKLLKI